MAELAGKPPEQQPEAAHELLGDKKSHAAKDDKKANATADAKPASPAAITVPIEPRALAAALVSQLGREVAKQVRAALEQCN